VASQILLLPSVYNGEPSGSKETDMAAIVSAMASVATSKGCRTLDVRTGRPTGGAMTVDGIHLSEPGKAYLCGRASEAIAIA
jgi:hypothetical protein